MLAPPTAARLTRSYRVRHTRHVRIQQRSPPSCDQSDAIRETPRAAVWSLIGNTPLVRLGRLEPHAGVEIHAKLESKNPGGSVKDRAAASMILDGLRTGALPPGRTLLDATSGNTGIAYAMLGAALGYPVKLCVPSSVTEERKRLLHVYGAEVLWTSPMEGSDGAIRLAQQLYAEDPDPYFYPDQYSNPANWRAHYETTGPEILEQTRGAHHPLRRGAGHERNLRGNGPAAARGATRTSG